MQYRVFVLGQDGTFTTRFGDGEHHRQQSQKIVPGAIPARKLFRHAEATVMPDRLLIVSAGPNTSIGEGAPVDTAETMLGNWFGIDPARVQIVSPLWLLAKHLRRDDVLCIHLGGDRTQPSRYALIYLAICGGSWYWQSARVSPDNDTLEISRLISVDKSNSATTLAGFITYQSRPVVLVIDGPKAAYEELVHELAQLLATRRLTHSVHCHAGQGLVIDAAWQLCRSGV